MNPERSNPARMSDEEGFTLVEVLIAIVVLVFGLIAVTNLLVVAASSNTVAKHSSGASTTAAARLEILKSTTFHNVTVGGNLDADVAGFFQDDDLPGLGRVHTRWLVEILPVTTGGAKFITVRSEGQGALAQRRSRAEFTTIRACTDLANDPGVNCVSP